MELTAINRGTGAIKIHARGCVDIKRNARGSSVWDIDADSVKDVVLDCYPPDDFGYDADTEWDSFNDLVFVACCPNLPQESATVVDAPATRTYRSHAECGHPRTPKDRAACRKNNA